MAVQLTIDSITGQSPYDIYVCQTGGTGCFYMTTINSVPYTFNIPAPYDNLSAYMLKVIDANGCIITGEEPVTTCSNVTPTPTPTITTTPTTTPTITPTSTITPTPSSVYYSGIFCTGVTQNDACVCTGTTTLYSTQPFYTLNQQVYIQPIFDPSYWAPFGLFMVSGGTTYEYQYTMFAPGLVNIGACPSPTPTMTSTNTPTPTVTSTNTPTPTLTSTPGASPSPTQTQTSTPTTTPTITPTNTQTSTPTTTPTITPTETPTNTPTVTPTITTTITPTSTPTNTPTSTPTITPTNTPLPSPTPISYLGYLADEYTCGYDIGGVATGCTLTASNVDVRIPTTLSPIINRYYAPTPGGCSGNVYFIIGSSVNNTGPIINGTNAWNVCIDACQEECPF